MDVQQALRNIETVTPKLAVEEIACIRSQRGEAITVLWSTLNSSFSMISLCPH